MEFRILGPLEVWRDGQLLPIHAAKQRTLLAMLLLQANQVVETDRLIEQLWGDEPPRTARNTLQTLVLRLRRMLQPAQPDERAVQVLVSHAAGYALRVAPEQLDVSRFEALERRAGRAMASGDLERAATWLREALGLWRGPVLADVPAEALRQLAAPELEERRLVALEERIEADLRLGRHAQLVGELGALVAEHPLRERLYGQLMLALYRAGRRGEALAAYRAARRVLGAELGLDPGITLQRLERAILRGDPTLDLKAREALDLPRPAAPAPCQLPPDSVAFTGRSRELEELRALLGRATGPATICTIDGGAGIGKSALAIRAAYASLGRFDDGCLWVDLQCGTAGLAPLEPEEVLGRFLRSLGLDSKEIPDNLDEAAARFRSLLAGRGMLVILDNAASAAQVRPLLPTGPRCAALITSRRILTALDGVRRLHLEVLPAGDAVALLARLAGRDRVAAEPQAAAAIAEMCGRLPLALRIVGARLAARPNWPLSALGERLANERGRLDELHMDDLEVRASFEVAYRALRERQAAGGDDDARLFRLLGLLARPEVGVPAAAALLEEPRETAAAALERLVDMSLLDSPAPGRYRLHDLVHLFARERSEQEDSEPARAAALTRVLRFYLVTAQRADELLRPGQPAVAGGEWEPLAFDDRAAALAWLELERSNLVASVRQAAAPGVPCEIAGALAATLFGFFDLRSYWTDWEQVNRLALGFAQQRRDRAGQARAHRDLGALAWRRYQLGAALAHLREALRWFREVGDRRGEGLSLNNLGLVYFEQRRYGEAAACLEGGLAAFREVGDRRGAGLSLNNLGMVHFEQRRYGEATGCLGQDLAISRELGDLRGEAITLKNLGDIHRAQRHYDVAADRYQQSFDICLALGDRRGQAIGLDDLGETCRLRGRLAAAVDYLESSLELRRAVGDRRGEAETLWHLGLALRARGEQESATGCWRAALGVFERLGAPQAADVRALLGEAT
jgi:DNA-binding SARP family transcriptional activator/Tfp pilus assembly protein PilF